ncbi:DUF4253 domain-containing protein [Sphingomonas sp. DG1-23]|uniref:DUF4253 domain-containing protein n=1 Tax=Sphingomonas sp. DG1-23 TaxID=3068316 RepID=UPI00273E7A7F|nr:DUF4253 domain-containing protein [Sphingomonas sp. DG1-23]MDP5279209.1 DUF4253 domain-containing protein [Sphingomonas sp. DG1-23]
MRTFRKPAMSVSMKPTRRSILGGLAATGLVCATRPGLAQSVPASTDPLIPERRAEQEAMRARMMAALKYERITVPGGRALAEWERLKRIGRGWPVIIGGDEDLARIADQFTMDDPAVSGVRLPDTKLRSPAEILATAKQLRFPTDLRKWPGTYQPNDLGAPIGEWPSEVGQVLPGPSIATDILSGKVLDRVHILLIPARFGWEVPAYLRWGDWNACPPPEYHVAALRTWHAAFGAELVAINGDTMNLRAANRPKTRDAAMALARDQYGYCPDIVDQGAASVAALAAILMASEWWFFWWD